MRQPKTLASFLLHLLCADYQAFPKMVTTEILQYFWSVSGDELLPTITGAFNFYFFKAMGYNTKVTFGDSDDSCLLSGYDSFDENDCTTTHIGNKKRIVPKQMYYNYLLNHTRTKIRLLELYYI